MSTIPGFPYPAQPVLFMVKWHAMVLSVPGIYQHHAGKRIIARSRQLSVICLN